MGSFHGRDSLIGYPRQLPSFLSALSWHQFLALHPQAAQWSTACTPHSGRPGFASQALTSHMSSRDFNSPAPVCSSVNWGHSQPHRAPMQSTWEHAFGVYGAPQMSQGLCPRDQRGQGRPHRAGGGAEGQLNMKKEPAMQSTGRRTFQTGTSNCKGPR